MNFIGTANQHRKTGEIIVRAEGDGFTNSEDWHTVRVEVKLAKQAASTLFADNYFFRSEEEKFEIALKYGYHHSMGDISINNQPFVSRGGWGYDNGIKVNKGIHTIEGRIIKAWYHTELGEKAGFKHIPNSKEDHFVTITTNVPQLRQVNRPKGKIGSNEYWTRLEARNVYDEHFPALDYMRQTTKLYADDIR